MIDLPQGPPELIHVDLARRLLAQVAPARPAYTALDDTPRIALRPTWVGIRDFPTRCPQGFADRGRA